MRTSLTSLTKSFARLCVTIAVTAVVLPLVSLLSLGSRSGDIWPR